MSLRSDPSSWRTPWVSRYPTERKMHWLKLPFPAHAVAITGGGSELDKLAEAQEWLRRFPM